ncbi:hypothetical protein CRUP_026293 [Coryphaenoides rupestris]|nr:hypothetical protein CRUP_026293 [Coryphaenoides rupestris]
MSASGSSWSGGGDDVFDEDADADDLRLQNREWRHNMEKRVKDGFVEGMDLGKSEFLQVGFNQGYREGARKTVAIGRLKGIVSAIHCWCQQQQQPPPPQDSAAVPRDSAPMPRDYAPAAAVSALLRRVEQHEVRLMTEIRQEMPMVSISDSLGVTIEEEEEEKEKEGHCSGTGQEEEGGGCGNEGGGCCGECGKEGGGCGCGNKGGGCCGEGGGKEEGGGGGSKKTDCCQKGGGEKQEHAARESLNELLQACQQVAEELGLPQELIEHVQSLRSMQ